MRRGATERETCELNGWVVGTCLVGDEGYGPSVIKITAIGETSILARCLSRKGRKVAEREHVWTLACREWTEVSPCP